MVVECLPKCTAGMAGARSLGSVAPLLPTAQTASVTIIHPIGFILGQPLFTAGIPSTYIHVDMVIIHKNLYAGRKRQKIKSVSTMQIIKTG